MSGGLVHRSHSDNSQFFQQIFEQSHRGLLDFVLLILLVCWVGGDSLGYCSLALFQLRVMLPYLLFLSMDGLQAKRGKC